MFLAAPLRPLGGRRGPRASGSVGNLVCVGILVLHWFGLVCSFPSLSRLLPVSRVVLLLTAFRSLGHLRLSLSCACCLLLAANIKSVHPLFWLCVKRERPNSKSFFYGPVSSPLLSGALVVKQTPTELYLCVCAVCAPFLSLVYINC